MEGKSYEDLGRGQRAALGLLAVWIFPILLALTAFALPSGSQCTGRTGEETCALHMFGVSYVLNISPDLAFLISGALFGGIGASIFSLRPHTERFTDASYSVWLRQATEHIASGFLFGALSYLFIRGVAFAPDARIADANPKGLAFIAVACGLFAPQLIQYLTTFARNQFEQPSGKDIERAIQKLDDRVGSMLARPSLDSWSGVVGIEWAGGDINLASGEQRWQVAPGREFDFYVVFEGAYRKLESPWQEYLAIRGEASPTGRVEFELAIDGVGFPGESAPHRIVFVDNRPLEAVRSKFRLTAPLEPTFATLILSVLQKGVLVQSLVVPIEVGGSLGFETWR